MAHKHFKVRYRLDGVDRYLIWFSNDSDGVVVQDDGSMVSFRSQSDLDSYAKFRGLKLEPDEPSEFDFDSVERWLSRLDRGSIDCDLFLNAWNLFGDIASSNGNAAFQQSSRAAGRVYDKLFWGNNLPAVTPAGELYVPVWSERDVDELHRILSQGMSSIRNAVSMML